MGIHAPVIATGSIFADYLDAARKNLDALVRLTAAHKDAEAAKQAQYIIDTFDDASMDLNDLIARASDVGADDDQYWRESESARARGMDEGVSL